MYGSYDLRFSDSAHFELAVSFFWKKAHGTRSQPVVTLKVRVRYFGVIREIAEKREETFEVPVAVTLLSLLRTVAAKYGGNMESYLFDSNAITPRPIHMYLLNGEAFKAGQASTVRLDEGSVVSIIPTQGG